MNIGDLFVKLADGTPLSQEEKQQLRLYGNQTQLNNSFVAGLQNGKSDIIAKSVEYQSMPIRIIYSKVIEKNISSLDVEIPSYSQHIKIVGLGRVEAASGGTVFIRFNGDSDSNYEVTYVQSNGTSVTTGQLLAQNRMAIGQFSNSGDAAGSASSFEATVAHSLSNYTQQVLSATYYNDGTTRSYYSIGGKYLVAGKIDRISLFALDGSGNPTDITAGAVFSVYGML